MNYLAHSFLSGNSPEIIAGNFIGDFVKGNSLNNYPNQIKQGILLHRAIDSFTDNSKIVKQSKEFFNPVYGKYSGIIVDVVYDFFLSQHWNLYSNCNREDFINFMYDCIEKYRLLFPLRAQKLVPSIIYHNWIRYYASYYGLEKVLSRMSIRTSLPNKTRDCIGILRNNYKELDDQFLEFFGEIQKEFWVHN